MITLRRPTAATLEAFRKRAEPLSFSYAEVGQIAGPTPRGYWPLCHQATVGQGPDAFAAACVALNTWAMIPPWVTVHGPMAAGATVVVASHQLGLHTLNACRILTCIAEPTRHGFIYGTLPPHVERGEERFLVEFHADGRVTYEVRSFSRPAHPLVWLTLPIARALQHRFARDSIACMRAALAKV